MSSHGLQLLYGGKDLLKAVDDLRARILAGELDAVVLVSLSTDLVCDWSWACREDAAVPWSRMYAATAATAHELMTEGI